LFRFFRALQGSLLFVGALLFLASACLTPLATSLRPDRPLQLKVLDAEGSLREIGGQGPLRLVVIWASWCSVCERALERAQKIAKAQTVLLIDVNVDANRKLALEARQRLALDGPFLWDPSAASSSAAGVAHLPTLLLLDPLGRVISIFEEAEEGEMTKLARDLAEHIERSKR